MKTKKAASLILGIFLVCLILPFCINNLAAKAQPPPDGNIYLLSTTVNSAGCSVIVNPNQETYSFGDIVQLIAIAAPGWNFSEWTGDLTCPYNPLTITIQANMSITALFVTNIYNLTVYTIGQGSVIPGNSSYMQDVNITLTATSDDGWVFQKWSDNSTNSNLTITMNDNQNITATFVQSPQPTPEPTSTPTPTAAPATPPTATPTAISRPTATPSSSPNVTPTPLSTTNSTTPPPPANTAGINEYVLVVVAGVILVGTVLGMIWQTKGTKKA